MTHDELLAKLNEIAEKDYQELFERIETRNDYSIAGSADIIVAKAKVM